MAQLKNATSSSITNHITGEAVLIQCEIIGDALRIHHFVRQDGTPDHSKFGVTPLNCDLSAGTFRNLTAARKVAKALLAVPGANWLGRTHDECLPSPEIFRAAYDAVRPFRVA